MDEEELEQPSKKITLSNFFESIVSVDRVAKTALKLSHKIEVTNPNTKKKSSIVLEGLADFFG